MKTKMPRMTPRELDKLADTITEALNVQHEDAPGELTGAKFAEIDKALKTLGYTGAAYNDHQEDLAERLGYTYPFVTDKDERVKCAMPDLFDTMLAHLSEIHDENMEHEGGMTKHRREEPKCEYMDTDEAGQLLARAVRLLSERPKCAAPKKSREG